MLYRGKILWACANSLVKIHSQAPPAQCKLLDHGRQVQDGLALSRNLDEPPWEAAALIAILLATKAVVFVALYCKTAMQ